ncbi:MAG: histidinol-phosphate transaminase [Pseudomonadota bacterium]|nr:histidinol-phosphate transaminase [Pseudomonadota bacterium]
MNRAAEVPTLQAAGFDDSIALVRDDLRDFAGYRSARSDPLQGDVWLNANESPWPSPADAAGEARRYPDPQPAALRDALSALYGCRPAQLLAGRGSDEGIDLLVRAICRPGRDAIVVAPPTFGMYAVSARLHGARVVEVPLVDAANGWNCDFEQLAAAVESASARLVFVCSPGNPSGTLMPLDDILALARRLQGRAMVVVDEAYIEFADGASAVSLIDRQANVIVLRTLSKAHALAAARIGSVIAREALIAVLQRCQAPYPLPGPCVQLACDALAGRALAITRTHVAAVRGERGRLLQALAGAPGVLHAYPSQANFVLVRFANAQAVFERLLAAGVVVRDMRASPRLENALRITVGSPEQNRRVVTVLQQEVPA